jgi:phosphate-selective porin
VNSRPGFLGSFVLYLTLAGLFLLALCGPLWASEEGKPSQKELRKKVRLLQEQLDDLKAEIRDATRQEESFDLKVKYEQGLRFRTSDEKVNLRLGGFLQFHAIFFDRHHPEDTSFFGDAPSAGNNAFLLRRARLFLRGKVYEWISGEVEAEFAEDVALRDAYLNLHLVDDALQFRAGQFKEPFSRQRMNTFYPSIERSMVVDNLTPGRDIGFMAHGSVADGLFLYALGFFNGEGVEPVDRGDQNDDKDFAARLVLRPTLGPEGPFLLLGGSLTVGREDTTLGLHAFETAGDTDFLTFNPGVIHEGRRIRYGLESGLEAFGFFLNFELIIQSLDELRNGPIEKDYDFWGWHLEMGYLWGGWREGSRVLPEQPFYPGGEGSGAFEFFFRVGQLEADEDLIKDDFAVGTDLATAYTIGLAWYPHWNTRFAFNYVRTVFDDTIAIGGTGGLPGPTRPGAKFRDNDDVFLFQLELEI